ncbi:MAG: glucosamine--fructose-6-phosphate aminotransferase (isomerizing) [Candidatus Promineifilaceae bacterium]
MSNDTGMMPIANTREEVAAQPQVIARVLTELATQIEALAQQMAERKINKVLASGSGDSWFAAQAVRCAWETYAGVPFEPLQAYEYAAYGRLGDDEQTAHFIISSSGRPTTTWDALDLALASGALVVGITDNPAESNPFATKPSVSLIPRGSKVGWPAQTTSATIATLISLAIAFGKARGHLSPDEATQINAQLNAIPEQMTAVLEQSAAWAETFVATHYEQHSGKRCHYTFVGGGPSFAMAQNGSALLAAGPQDAGMALTVEEFHHALRIGVVQPEDVVVLIAPQSVVESRCRDTTRVVRAWGSRLLVIATPETADLLQAETDGIILPAVADAMSPLLTLMPLHALSIALAAHKVATGYRRPKTVPQ